MVQRRSIGMAVLLTIVTCGLYGIYWFIMLTDEINALTGDTNGTSGGMAFLFTILTCGIYSWVWMYQMGDKLDRYDASRGLPTGNRGILYLILTLFGLGIVSYCLMQDSINKSI